jgi:hypothetical protein
MIGSVLIVQAQQAATSAPPATQPAGATGTWKWTSEGFGGQVETVLTLKQDGEKLTGTITGFQDEVMEIRDGKVQDGQITFKVVRDFGGQEWVTTYTGKIEGSSLKGRQETVIVRTFDAKRS